MSDPEIQLDYFYDPFCGWCYASAPALKALGERTGKFRLGKDDLLVNGRDSSISFEDYAIALVDEIETPKHSRERFTVGY